MNIQSTRLPKTRPDKKIARIILHPDGKQEFVFEDDHPSISDIAKNPSTAVGASAFWATNKLAQMNHDQIASVLNNRFPAIRPDNGWNNIAKNVEELASDPTVQNIVISVSAGFVSYPAWKYAFERFGLDSPKIKALWASGLIAIIVFILLSLFSSSPVTIDQCNKGYPEYKGNLTEVRFSAACNKLAG